MRKICLVTSTRADFGILKPLCHLLQDSKKVDFQLVITGMHLSEKYGMTIDEIIDSGLIVKDKIEILSNSSSEVGVCKTIGKTVISFSDYFFENRPDILVLLGDRYEMLGVATAATIFRIPIAHIHGGETTRGLIDEPIRHSLTKMAHLHFCSTEKYKSRILQMGEMDKYVFNYGAPSVDSIKKVQLMNRKDLAKSLGFEFRERNLIVTYHPVTLSGIPTMKPLLDALWDFPDLGLIFTMPNSDTFSDHLIKELKLFVKQNSHRAKLFQSLGQIRYFSCLNEVDAVVGNSSSGIIEAAYFKCPTIDIGIRQEGRERGASVIHCRDDGDDIKLAIQRILANDDIEFELIYGEGNSSGKIFSKLISVDLDSILYKQFNDMVSV